MKDICNLINKGNKYFIYGTTIFAKYCCDKICEAYGENSVIGFLESEKRDEPFDWGKLVLLPAEAIERYGDDVLFILAGFKSYGVMKENLLRLGVSEDRIVRPIGFEPYFQIGYPAGIKNVCFWPEIHAADEDVLKKIAWFLPDRLSVTVFSTEDLRKNIRDNVSVCRLDEATAAMEKADAILLWDLSREGSVGERFGEKIRVVDPDFYMTIDAENYCRAYDASFESREQDENIEASKQVFLAMQERAKGKTRANVFGTGPSLFEIEDFGRFKDDFNIICNSMVKDRELLSALRPDLIAFADICFYFSPSAYGQAFYKDLLEAQKEHDFYLLVRDCEKPLIEYHFPELQGRVMGMPYIYDDRWWLVDADHFYLKPMDNIVTDMMLPMAAALCNTIGIVGCTGRAKGESYFWEHNHSVQYEELKPTVFSMWRAFFHKRKYDVYFDQHCRNVEDSVRFGELQGKTYINYTTSYIPALAERSTGAEGAVAKKKGSSL